MQTNPNLTIDPTDRFEPAMFSIPELHFLADHMKEPPVVAFDGFDPGGKHRGVVRPRVETTLRRFEELESLYTHKQQPWAGFATIQDSIERFLVWHDRSTEIKRRGGPAYPSIFQWDDLGIPARYAIGADSGEMVRTEILDSGDRKAFGVKLTMSPNELLATNMSDVMPWIRPASEQRAEQQKDIVERSAMGGKSRVGNLRCSICGHTEEYDTANRGTQAGANARMGRHLKRAKTDVNRHRMLYARAYR